MKQVYQSDWDEVKEKLHLDYMVIDCWGKAFTIDPVSLSDVMIVQGHSDGTISVSLEVSLEENAEALLGALEKEKEYFFAFKHRYPWREIIERKLWSIAFRLRKEGLRNILLSYGSKGIIKKIWKIK